MIIHSESSWSRITDTPVFVYDPKYDAHLCYWRGIQMTRSYAHIIIAMNWFEMSPSAAHFTAAYDEHKRLMLCGVMNSTDYSEKSTHYALMQELELEPIIKQYTPQQAFAWMLNEHEIVIKNEETV